MAFLSVSVPETTKLSMAHVFPCSLKEVSMTLYFLFYGEE